MNLPTNYFKKITQRIYICSIEHHTWQGITNLNNNCSMSASIQLLLLLLCAIIYKLFQPSSIFCPFQNILTDLYSSVKCGSITGNLKKEYHLCTAVFAMSQPTNLKYLLWGQYFWNLPTKSKPCCDDPVIPEGTFLLESPKVLLISTVRSLDNLAVIKTQIAVPQKLGISNFREINMVMQLTAISLLDLSILMVILQRQVINLLI